MFNEIIADFIETGDYEGEGRGMVGAIRYLTKKELAGLKTASEKEALSLEMLNAAAAERKLLGALSDYLETGSATVPLNKEGKATLKPYFAEIKLLFSLRNRSNAEEVKKLSLLGARQKSDDTDLVFLFRKTSEGRFVIRGIRFRKREAEKPDTKAPESFV